MLWEIDYGAEDFDGKSRVKNSSKSFQDPA
jgi:hypothetical protein